MPSAASEQREGLSVRRPQGLQNVLLSAHSGERAVGERDVRLRRGDLRLPEWKRGSGPGPADPRGEVREVGVPAGMERSGVCEFDFAELCRQPTGAGDYISLCRRGEACRA